MGLIKRSLDAAHRFTAWDYAFFKICLLALGIIFGAYFSSFFLKYISIVWIVFAVTWVILIIQVIRYFKKPKD